MKAKHKNVLMVCDGNWLINRAHSVYMTHRNPAESTARQVVAWMFDYGIIHRATHLLLAIDGDNLFRKTIFKDYKISRQRKREQDAASKGESYSGGNSNPVYECLGSLFARMDTLGLFYLQSDLFEADDILVGCANKFSSPDCKVVMVCNDKDEVQGLINPNVLLWTPSMQKKPEVRMTCEHIHALGRDFDNAIQFLHYQILIGDPMDDVPQLMTPGKAYKIVKEHGTLGKWFKTKEGKAWAVRNQGALNLNRELITMANASVDKLMLSQLRPTIVEGHEDVKPKSYYDYFGAAKMGRRSLFG